MARCYFEARLHHLPTKNWSKVNGAVFLFCLCYLKSILVTCADRRVHNARTLMRINTHSDAQQHTNMSNI